ncbi:MAG TPA: polysaccharide deacetylase family protein [Burkholderiaceae bacterium]
MLALARTLSKDLLQQAIFPDRFLWRLPKPRRAIALTFDDGPHPEHTPAMLDVLARAGVRATFFVVGREVEKHPEVARRIVAEGHGIGGHSYDHTVMTTLDDAALVDDLAHCRRVIREATGLDTGLFRPPKGEVSLRSIRTACRAGYTLVHWTRTYSDYRQDGVDALTRRIDAEPPIAGDVLLFHDHNPYTVRALDSKLPQWRAKGLQFAPLNRPVEQPGGSSKAGIGKTL